MRKPLLFAAGMLAALAACGGDAEPSAENMINDASDMEASTEQSVKELSGDLRNAASQSGDLPCGLPPLPDASAAQAMAGEGGTFTTQKAPEEVAAFYIAAAEARGGTASAAGPPGFSEIQIVLGDASACTAFAQAQMSGGTNVQILSQ